MTHWTRPKGLGTDLRAITATRLRAIADQLTADHASAVEANLIAWADPTPWPSTVGQGGSSSGPGSPVEHAADVYVPIHLTRSSRLLANLHQLAHLARDVDDGLAEVNPARTIAYCPNPACGRALLPGARCTACSTRQEAEPVCADCGNPFGSAGSRPWPPEGRRRDSDAVVAVCVRDWMFRHRHDGRPRNGIERLALGAGLIEQEATG